jgi:hypothetical protein
MDKARSRGKVITGMALHPDIICFFLFFLGARIAEAKYVSFWDIVRP